MDYNPLLLFGEHLSRLRKAKGWSQEVLALRSGLARSYVGGIERGQRNLSLINICVLASTLELSPRDMLDFVSTPQPPADPPKRAIRSTKNVGRVYSEGGK